MGNVKNPLIALIGTGETTDQTYQVQRYRSLTNANVNMQILPDLASSRFSNSFDIWT